MTNTWMVRAGEHGYLVGEFERRGLVSIGWNEIGDLSSSEHVQTTRAAYNKAYPDQKPGKIGNAVAMIHKFRSILKPSDHVITYDPARREYLVGTIVGDYEFDPSETQDQSHLRKVSWLGRVSRDRLSVASRNTLGSTLTLFSVPPEVWSDISAAFRGGDKSMGKPSVEQIKEEEESEGIEESREDTEERARELIKDKILRLGDGEMEQLVATLFRAMGYKARVTPKGPDRGVDVFASPDGLGLQEPRIKAEVKHRPNTTIGSQDLRSFLGGLRPGDRGLYVSTGGYTKEAKYEADRANIPVTLLDLEGLADMVITHYEKFDPEGRALIPLVKVYWPAR